ncbi:MAG TPA: hypothetical protein VED17_09335 [Nitrososphaerales archaeon]|nr:hypothetical protein [Nitrososphaerales archaeon]
MTDCWDDFVEGVKSGCCSHASYTRVKPGVEPWNGFELERPKKFHRGILFILEAPPAGSNHFFLKNETDNTHDRLRQKFFVAFQKLPSAPEFRNFETFLDEFLNANCYLLPSFSYACANKDGTNTSPTAGMARHSGEAHLQVAIKCLKPRVVVLMGTRALAAGKAMRLVNEDLGKESLVNYASLKPYHSTALGFPITTFVTYWPMKRSKREDPSGKMVNNYDAMLIPTLNRSFETLYSSA